MRHGDSILDALDQIPGLTPGSEVPAQPRLDAIRASAIRSLRPVRPLPSSPTLILLALALFVVFSILATVPTGFVGFHHLSLSQKLAYYGVVLLAAAFLCTSVVKEIIPGSSRRLPPFVSLLLPFVLITLTAFALFPRHDLARFTSLGIPCLKLGTFCAALSGILAYLLMRRGFAASPLRTSVAAGLLSGLAGFSVLALHCPVQNIAHIAVWHLGAVEIATAAGALLGLLRPAPRS